jgi:protein disulfide-isomerase A1
MFSKTLLCLFLAFVVASDVTDLTDATFDAYVKKEPLALIEFFAPWCGHVF